MADQENHDAPTKPIRYLGRVLEELGLVSLYKSHRDTKLLILQRFVRLFGYGSSTLILAAYISDLGTSDTHIGLFMTLTLVGDVFIGFCLTLVADALGRRRILALGAILMAASGIVFAVSYNYWVLLVAAILGVISPSGNEVGPFRAIEESTIAHLTISEHRPDIFAWYSLLGTAGTSLGIMVSGWVTNVLIHSKGWSTVQAYRVIYYVYALIGLIKFILTLVLSKDCEAEKQPPTANPTETAPLLGLDKKPKKNNPLSLVPQLSPESKAILFQLCILFAFDNFASGLAPLSWVTYYFKRRFNLAEGKLGTLFFVTSLIQAASMLVAASIARRIGNIKTMVFTHLPSSIFLALIGIPSQLPLAMVLVVLRACTQSMDGPPRSAFLAAVVLPNERTAVMGTINVVKTSSQSLGPLITGVLATKKLFWVAFLMAGALKATYDVGILAVFAGHKTREERAVEESRENVSES